MRDEDRDDYGRGYDPRGGSDRGYGRLPGGERTPGYGDRWRYGPARGRSRGEERGEDEGWRSGRAGGRFVEDDEGYGRHAGPSREQGRYGPLGYREGYGERGYGEGHEEGDERQRLGRGRGAPHSDYLLEGWPERGPGRREPEWRRYREQQRRHGRPHRVSGGRRRPQEPWEDRPGVSFRGVGPKGYRRSDERIREDVCDWLTSDERIDASELSVRVEDGEVFLSGSISDRYTKRLAEDLAARPRGVHDVINEIRVRREPRRPEVEPNERKGRSNGQSRRSR